MAATAVLGSIRRSRFPDGRRRGGVPVKDCASSGDHSAYGHRFGRSLKSARSQRITRSIASTSGRMGIATRQPIAYDLSIFISCQHEPMLKRRLGGRMRAPHCASGRDRSAATLAALRPLGHEIKHAEHRNSHQRHRAPAPALRQQRTAPLAHDFAIRGEPDDDRENRHRSDAIEYGGPK
jgi:hypothetical protein